MLLRYYRHSTQLSGKNLKIYQFTLNFSPPYDGNINQFRRELFPHPVFTAQMKSHRDLDQHKAPCIFTVAHDSCISETSHWYREQYPCSTNSKMF